MNNKSLKKLKKKKIKINKRRAEIVPEDLMSSGNYSSIKMRRNNYWTPLQALHDDDNAESTDTQVQSTNTKKKEYISPIKVLSHNCEQFHKMFKNSGVTKYYIQKISIGIKIICETKETFNDIITILKEHNCQFYTHESKHNKPFKFVMFGLDGKSEDEVKQALVSLNYKCINVKKIEKKYNEYVDTIYIVYFENGSVKLHDLKQNTKSLFHMIIKWEYQRKIKNKPVQCHNCQMFGHGEKGCSIKTRCALCSGRHKTSECINKEKVKCANCNNTHKATDISCPVRESFLLLRENINRKNSRSQNYGSMNLQNRRRVSTNINILENNAFPPLPKYNEKIVNASVWPNTNRNNNKTTSSNELFTVEEISQLTLDVINKLKTCKTKEEQFNIITQLAIKYLYNI